ncbi:MAG: hypothetical protein R2802_13285 [Flavobacteriaceae bacterium]|nr:hypothetical protein [Mangrovimonas sp.]MCB0439258.1 hypothetical protein [Mangrovimonas sp.]HRV54307.1 hypothetical protein [Mangrovimonas sp.]
MQNALNYRFERKSKNFLDWLVYTVRSEKYHQVEGFIVNQKFKSNL